MLGTGNTRNHIDNLEVFMAEKKYKDGRGQWGQKWWGAAKLCERYRAIVTTSDKSPAEQEKELDQLCAEFAGYIAKFKLECPGLDREFVRFLSEDADLRFLSNSKDESPGFSYLTDAKHNAFGTPCEALAKLFKLRGHRGPAVLRRNTKASQFLSFKDKGGRQYFYNDEFYPGHGGEAALESLVYRDELVASSELQCKRPPPGNRAAISEDAKKKRK